MAGWFVLCIRERLVQNQRTTHGENKKDLREAHVRVHLPSPLCIKVNYYHLPVNDEQSLNENYPLSSAWYPEVQEMLGDSVSILSCLDFIAVTGLHSP